MVVHISRLRLWFRQQFVRMNRTKHFRRRSHFLVNSKGAEAIFRCGKKNYNMWLLSSSKEHLKSRHAKQVHRNLELINTVKIGRLMLHKFSVIVPAVHHHVATPINVLFFHNNKQLRTCECDREWSGSKLYSLWSFSHVTLTFVLNQILLALTISF